VYFALKQGYKEQASPYMTLFSTSLEFMGCAINRRFGGLQVVIGTALDITSLFPNSETSKLSI